MKLYSSLHFVHFILPIPSSSLLPIFGGSHGSIGRGAGGCGLAHCDRYRRVLIVALHHLDGPGIAGGRGAHLSTLRLVQLASDLPIDGLRILWIAFRAENGSGLEQLQQIQAILGIPLGTKGSNGRKK